MTPHKFDRVNVTQEMIDSKYCHLHSFVHKPGIYIKYFDGAGDAWLQRADTVPGNSCIIVCPHCQSEYVNNGYADSRDICPHCKQERVRFAPPTKSMDISSGFGIGGAGSDDYNMATERDINTHPEQTGCKWGGTRYDESCAGCGRVTEICNDCELCERCHE